MHLSHSVSESLHMEARQSREVCQSFIIRTAATVAFEVCLDSQEILN
jgi:hypothetical protein